MKKRHSSFAHILTGIAHTFIAGYEEIEGSSELRPIKFNSFKELDEYLSREIGQDWKEEEWAKFWIRNHNSHEAHLYREHKLNRIGRKSRKRIPGSVRYERDREGSKRISRIIPRPTLLAIIRYYQSVGFRSLRELENILFEAEDIVMDKDTIRLFLQNKNEVE